MKKKKLGICFPITLPEGGRKEERVKGKSKSSAKDKCKKF